MFFIFIYYVCHKFILQYPSGPVKLAAWSLQLAAFFFFNFFGQAIEKLQSSRLTQLDPRSNSVSKRVKVINPNTIGSGLKFGQVKQSVGFPRSPCILDPRSLNANRTYYRTTKDLGSSLFKYSDIH